MTDSLNASLPQLKNLLQIFSRCDTDKTILSKVAQPYRRYTHFFETLGCLYWNEAIHDQLSSFDNEICQSLTSEVANNAHVVSLYYRIIDFVLKLVGTKLA